jgi:uncharacterized membrane protein
VSTSSSLVFVGAFLASAVEMVEALTIVLGVGVVRGWRAPLIGAGAATIVLAALVAALGPALKHVPIDSLRFAVGALLLAFGLQWLRKAILRASGYKSLHDEDEAFRQGREQAAGAPTGQKAGLDCYAFTIAFKGVLLEGLEVVFIVIAFGSAQGKLGLAAIGAAAAFVVVLAAGVGQLFAREECARCHTLIAAGALATSGPDLVRQPDHRDCRRKSTERWRRNAVLPRGDEQVAAGDAGVLGLLGSQPSDSFSGQGEGEWNQ